jgi:pimeloyl-ACP methyl ester carboxylesterase
MLLIHGAWQGVWSFGAWIPELAQRVWHAEAVDLPGNGCDAADRTSRSEVSLQRYVGHVRGLIERRTGQVVLVGHSGGGLTATAVAEAIPERVAAIVYLAGMMLPSGMAYADLVRQCEAEQPDVDISGVASSLRETEDGLGCSIDAQSAARIFLHDAPREAALQAAARLKPQDHAGHKVAPTWMPERFGRVPRIYVEALQDRSIHPAVQRRMQELVPGALRVSLDCGHVPQFVQPAASAQAVCDALLRVGTPHH